MYVTVPTHESHFATESARCPLTPKSLIFAEPSVLTRMLLGFTSRCTIFFVTCRYSKPRSVCLAISLSAGSSMNPSREVTSATLPPSAYSSTMLTDPSPKNAPR